MLVHKAYIALGSNLCDPALQIKRAFSALDGIANTTVTKRSSLYQTEPVGYDNQPDFINAVVEVQTDASPEALLTALLDIEQTFGRERPFPNAPRILDLDLLCYDSIVQNTDFLTLPHPRMHLRGFVLLPLAEIAPDFVIPSEDIIPNRANVVELAQAFQNQNIVKLDDQH
jgi:2-amino-4-hydroxy-6-hydroxymethyldihydropteridine diphosphokinase